MVGKCVSKENPKSDLDLGLRVCQFQHLSVVTTQVSNGLMDTEDFFRKLVGHNLRRSFTRLPSIVS